jgi:hypothetical protein
MNNEIGKTQNIRLADVFLLAPFMIYFGLKARGVSKTEKSIMIVAGVGTAIYNLNNYLKQKEQI